MFYCSGVLSVLGCFSWSEIPSLFLVKGDHVASYNNTVLPTLWHTHTQSQVNKEMAHSDWPRTQVPTAVCACSNIASVVWDLCYNMEK